MQKPNYAKETEKAHNAEVERKLKEREAQEKKHLESAKKYNRVWE